MSLIALTTLLASAAESKVPERLSAPAVLQKIEIERSQVEKLAKESIGAAIYGLNTLPGHRDSERVSVYEETALQLQILRSHLIPSVMSLHYSDFQTRCIGLCKAFAVASGGTGMSTGLYSHLLDALRVVDFRPAIPERQSYSSGDVIPASHWAAELLNWRGYVEKSGVRPGEAMALINGSFVHVGLAAANLPLLRACGERCAQAMAAVAALSGAPPQTFERSVTADMATAIPLLDHVIQRVASADRIDIPSTQPAVSVRGIPETLIAFSNAMANLAEQVNISLNLPSGNPLYNTGTSNIQSQGSFLAFTVSLAQSAMVEALLLIGWALVSQIQYILSGRVEGIKIDAATPEDPLGLIQIPKAMMAELESLRADCGRRCFASGGSTSNGIEDLWSYGEIQSRQVVTAARSVINLAVRAQAVCEIVGRYRPKNTSQSASGMVLKSAIIGALYERETWLHANRHPLPFMIWAGTMTE